MAMLGLCAVLISCGKAKRPQFNFISTCGAQACHATTPLMQSTPVTGKHGIHLSRGLICENCHDSYLTNRNHKNGVIDGSDRDGVGIVFFDAMNPATKWDIGARDCSSVECHGGGAAAISWYEPVSGDCGVCHSAGSRIDPLVTNGQGVRGKHSAHMADAKFDCLTCHIGYKEKPTHMNGLYGKEEPDTIVSFSGSYYGKPVSVSFDDNAGICSAASCHGGGGAINWYSDSNGCTACHAPGGTIDPLSTNGTGNQGKHVAHVTRKGIECVVCHDGYKDKTTHINGVYGKLETDPIVFYDSSNPTASWNNGTKVCNSMNCHGSVGWYVTGPVDCVICHIPGSSIDPLTINGSGTQGKHIKHVTDRGLACVKCHNGYYGAATHNNGIMDATNPTVAMTLFDAANPSGAWSDDTGPGTGSCSTLACHGSAKPDWYGTGSWTLPQCDTCHGAPVNARRQVLGAGGDFTAESHHVINYAARTTQIVQDTDCGVCHEMDHHMGGSIRLKNKDISGAVVVYDPAVPSTAEPFCLSCHDADGAFTEAAPLKPFNVSDPNTLGTAPNRSGVEIRSSWSKQHGHGKQGITCLGDGFTGCHGNYNTATHTGTINAHGSGNKGLLANKMTFPVTSSTWDESRYSLCLDCHNNYPGILTIQELVGVADGGNFAQPATTGGYTQWPYIVPFMVTGFHDYYSYGYNRQFNLHLYHLIENMGQWYYRGTGSSTIPVCTSCHNVHGVDGQYNLWDEWGFSLETVSGTEFGKLANANFVNRDYPAFCSGTCHWVDSAHPDHPNYSYPRNIFNEVKVVASRASGTLQNGDTVTIYFSNSTNGAAITISNIATVLSLAASGHTWIDPDDTRDPSTVIGVWSSTGAFTNNVLTINISTLAPDANNPTIAVGDIIKLDQSTITDDSGEVIWSRVGMAIRGN